MPSLYLQFWTNKYVKSINNTNVSGNNIKEKLIQCSASWYIYVNFLSFPFIYVNTVLFEHVLLYYLKESIPDKEYLLLLEEVEMVRPGEDINKSYLFTHAVSCDAGCEDIGEQRVWPWGHWH